ncbi:MULTISPECIES: hypothetical protein [unclassified Acinetobacter]|uniref:hypothetical protein n=1 Tax=unclassified Acinetobacter TaxID=196816 RepID=UPI00244862FF|nr:MULTISPECIES: hypothetical protein [unclassified Acinetobacter]MDH0029900.1 hypothetical protein [Acinetobacter sp. GD04021]MDH0885336.1 hypothetical protein [Acinetobacter sp. GD03873]MDH1081454.1 hypothetical protein [Acinetobacter sp. GD03983]MDH2188765.1 hypothetical protein [Acinetobacter sp. GD03645]MDH2203488.1 hypothetical protein [Acinetobacter sp. GD03647]
MEKWLYLLCLSVGFGLGYLVADFRHLPTIPSKPVPTVVKSDQHSPEITDVDDLTAFTVRQLVNNKAQPLSTLSGQQQRQISQILANTPEQQVSDYLKKAFPRQDFSMIRDKKVFAQRALEELGSQNDDQVLAGRLVLALTPVMPQSSEDLRQVHHFQNIFAHFDTLGKFPADQQVFIRWLNRDTGEILVFTPRNISQDSSQNWISTVPTNGWQKGNYDVKVYQMSDQLTPIAQASYHIAEVLN